MTKYWHPQSPFKSQKYDGTTGGDNTFNDEWIIAEKVSTHILHIDVSFCAGLHEFDTVLQRQLTAGEKRQDQCQYSGMKSQDNKYAEWDSDLLF